LSYNIPDDKIEELRERSSIVDVVSQYVTLKKTGKNFVGLCPFHSEKTPSFTVSEEKEIFHCFGCGAGGNVFSFLMKIEGRSFPEIVRDLAEKEGVELPDGKSSGMMGRGGDPRDERKDALYNLYDNASSLYSRLLMKSPEGAQARNYFKSRGIGSDIAKKWLLGYGGKGWSAFSGTLTSEKVREEAREAGLVIKSKKGSYYDRFRERLIFPICDMRGKVVAFGGRIVEGDGPKYVNSPESPVYTKGDVLYGLNIARNDIRSGGEAVLVEGYMDLLALYRYGIKNVVASLGTALTRAQALLLKRFCSKVVLLFDSDSAGIKAALRAVEVLLGCGLSPSVVTLPAGEDPDSFVNEKGEAALREKIGSPIPAIDFVLAEKLKEKPAASPSDKAFLIREIMPFVRLIEDSLERKLTLKRVAERLSVDEALLDEAMGGGGAPKRGYKAQKVKGEAEKGSAKKKSKAQVALETIFALTLWHSDVLEEALKSGVFKNLNDPDLGLIGQKIEFLSEKGKDITPSALMDLLVNDGQRERLSAILIKGDVLKGCSPVDVFRDCERILKQNSLLESELSITNRLNDALNRGDEKEVASLLEEKQRIIQARKNDLA